MFKKLIKLGLKKLGYKLVYDRTNDFSMHESLRRCIGRGIKVNTVIDVGASNGSWSKNCMEILPEANYLLIEAQEPHRKNLQRSKKENSNVEFIIAAAGAKEGSIYFDNSELFGGVASETPFEKNCIEVSAITIDKEIERRKLNPPFLIKLDTHGFEVPIIEGAMESIKQTELLIIETYNYKITEGSLQYFQMCSFMDQLGFSTIEIADLLLTENDNSLWQMDTFFVPSHYKKNIAYR
ncbi:MAG: FkbM family methyltransferase [Bacteroidia bacterium]|nr:FkbM family methyltransferase [Bacteroidia bacterium]